MMKSGKVVLIVESVKEATKFYTEKLAFDLIGLEVDPSNKQTLRVADLRKGKNFISIRAPFVEELAEFSVVKRCPSRCVAVVVLLKKGLDRLYERCLKKDLKIITELSNKTDGSRSFSIKDPFGTTLVFHEPSAHKPSVPNAINFLGMQIKRSDVTAQSKDDLVDRMAQHLKQFGILRRAAKKYSKLVLKELTK